MRLNELAPASGSRKSRTRKGRGVGSGKGKTAGRGSKGLKSRSGGKVRPGFEGGQMPLHRRLPKRGFTNIFKKQFAIVNLRDLSCFEQASVVDEAAMVQAGLVKGQNDGVKLLGMGEVDRPITIKVSRVSKSAMEKIIAAGGKVEGI